MTDNVTMTAVDGTDALAFVIIRPGPQGSGGVSIEAAAKGLSKPHAAYVLRHVADEWDDGATALARYRDEDGQVWALHLDDEEGPLLYREDADGKRTSGGNPWHTVAADTGLTRV